MFCRRYQGRWMGYRLRRNSESFGVVESDPIAAFGGDGDSDYKRFGFGGITGANQQAGKQHQE
jgi:hypothetical protein